MKISKELKAAIEAAKEAGKILNRYFDADFKVERKSDASPVTIADREAEKKIVSVIRKHFPDHNFLCEEFSYKKTDSEFTWIIDPLDGTKNFVRGVPFFGTIIALEKNGRILAGVINIPLLNMLGYATKGRGASVNGKRAKASKVNDLSASFLSFGAPKTLYKIGYGNQFLELVKKCDSTRGFGSPVEYLLIAQGSLEIQLDGLVKPWDIAAGKIIIEEAGGRVTDLEGKNTIYSGNALSTNGKLHDEVLKILAKSTN